MYTNGNMGVLFWAGIILIIVAVIALITRKLKWELPAGLAVLGVALTATQILQTAATSEKPTSSATTSPASSLQSSSPQLSQPSSPATESATGHEIRAMRAPYAGLCMAVDGDTVITADCTGTAAEEWTTDDMGRIVSSDGRCMDPSGTGGGQPLLVTSCDTSQAQEWQFADGRIWSGDLCLTIWGPYATPGTRIQTWNTQQSAAPADEMYWELA